MKGSTSSVARSQIERWLERCLRDQPPRSKSLIVTLFGDSLLSLSSGIWLSELAGLLQSFHVNAQLTRTSAFRLAEEGWLQSTREGRRSRYTLTASGRERVEHAHRRIYDPPAAQCDGLWTVVLLGRDAVSAAARAELRRELGWEGFGSAGPAVFVHPDADRDALNEILARLGPSRAAIVFEARDLEAVSSLRAHALVAECWNLEDVGAQYLLFVRRFQSVLPLLRPDLAPAAAFAIQTLLIHAFRRVVLHDPQLPAALLPPDWPGHAAYDLCRKIYQRTWKPTQQHLCEHVEEMQIPSRSTGSRFAARFGGL